MTEEFDFETITTELKHSSIVITINRPDSLNAINAKVLAEIHHVLIQDLDDKKRAVVIQGAGTKAFAAGADLSELANYTPTQALALSKSAHLLAETIRKIPQIVIAKVQGFALGGGCELAMCCDLIIASEKASFGQPEVNLGLIPGFGGTQRLVKRLGLPVALDMICTGKNRRLSGTEAFQLGLVSRVVAHENLDQEIESILTALEKTGPIAVSEAKRLCREAQMMPLEAGLSSEATSFANCFSSGEAKEGIESFLSKRDPEF